MPNVFDTFYETYQNAISNGYTAYRVDIQQSSMEMVKKVREYDEGVHNTVLTDRLKEFLHVTADFDFTVNYCPMVINAKSDRLKVTGFDSEESLSDMLWDWWRKNRMDRKQGIVHRAAIRDGDAYILVEWDTVANMPRFYYEPAYDGDGITVIYSDERRDEMEYAVKQWRINTGDDVGKMRRMNIYLPDRVEKYISTDATNKGAWMPYMDENTVEMPGKMGIAGVSWWTTTMTEDGDPLGIPIIHFKHNDTGYAHGTSHLANVMPIQDALNKAMIDLIGTMDTAGFGLLVGYGTTAWTGLNVGPGAIASVSNPPDQAKLERLPGENPSGLLAAYNALVMEIGRVSGTPLSYLQTSGQVSAEGTMKQQEVALVSQVKKAQTDFGNSWEDCMIMARRLYNVFRGSKPALNEDEIIDTVWDDAESRNDMEQAQMLAVRVGQLGVSEEQAQVEMGYDADDIAAFKREKLRKQALAIRQMQQAPPNEQQGNQNLTQTENENEKGTNNNVAA